MILEFTLAADDAPSSPEVRITHGYRPPLALQIDRATRATFSSHYYSTTTFKISGRSICCIWLASLANDTRAMVTRLQEDVRYCQEQYGLYFRFDNAGIAWHHRCRATGISYQDIRKKVILTYVLLTGDGQRVEKLLSLNASDNELGELLDLLPRSISD